jgi:hypothetical protein
MFDKHVSHQDMEAIQLARDSGVIILSVLPHITYKLQTPDVAVHKHFKTFFLNCRCLSEKQPWQENTPVRRGKASKSCYEKSATVEIVTHGFRKCWIQ